MTYPLLTHETSTDECPDCEHELWLHASGDLTVPQHCRAVTAEYDLHGSGAYGHSVYQANRCRCEHLLEHDGPDADRTDEPSDRQIAQMIPTHLLTERH